MMYIISNLDKFALYWSIFVYPMSKCYFLNRMSFYKHFLIISPNPYQNKAHSAIFFLHFICFQFLPEKYIFGGNRVFTAQSVKSLWI